MMSATGSKRNSKKSKDVSSFSSYSYSSYYYQHYVGVHTEHLLSFIFSFLLHSETHVLSIDNKSSHTLYPTIKQFFIIINELFTSLFIPMIPSNFVKFSSGNVESDVIIPVLKQNCLKSVDSPVSMNNMMITMKSIVISQVLFKVREKLVALNIQSERSQLYFVELVALRKIWKPLRRMRYSLFYMVQLTRNTSQIVLQSVMLSMKCEQTLISQMFSQTRQFTYILVMEFYVLIQKKKIQDVIFSSYTPTQNYSSADGSSIFVIPTMTKGWEEYSHSYVRVQVRLVPFVWLKKFREDDSKIGQKCWLIAIVACMRKYMIIIFIVRIFNWIIYFDIQRMQVQIKDRHKLFNKLFVSPTFDEPIEPPILISPNFITLILEESKSLPIASQKQVVQQLLAIFIKRPTNSLLLYHADLQININYTEKSILDDIVFRILELVSSQQWKVNFYVGKIHVLISYYKIGVKNISRLTQWLSLSTFQEKFNPIKLMFIIKVLNLYYGCKEGTEKAPKHYFYLLGNDHSYIKSVKHNHEELVFKNEICVVLAFNSHSSSSKYNHNLFYFKTNRNQMISVGYQQNSIFMSVIKDDQLYQLKCFENLKQKQWYRLMINFTPHKTQICLNDKILQYAAFIKKQKDRKFVDCVFGEGFMGMLAGITIANKPWSLQKFTFEGYRYGIQAWDSLIVFNKLSYASSVMLSCLPFSIFEIRDVKLCFDIFRRNHSQIGENIIIVEDPIDQDKITHLGGLKLILPLFYLARFYSHQEYPHLLEHLLQFLLTLFQYYDYSVLDQELNSDNSIDILGHHLFHLSRFQTLTSLKLLESIHKKIYQERTRAKYVKNILWSLNSQEFESEELIKFFYVYMIKIYESEGQVACKGCNFTQIVYWVLQNIESHGYNCCLQHYVNESMLGKDFDVDEISKGLKNNSLHYHYIQSLLANILERYLILKHEEGLELIKGMIRSILHKYSACLYSMIIRIIKKQISKFKGEKMIGEVLTDPQLDLVSYLIFLSEKTINVDIISDIVYLSLFIFQQTQNSQKKLQILNFLTLLLNRVQHFNEFANPFRKGLRNVKRQPVFDRQSSIHNNQNIFSLQKYKLRKQQGIKKAVNIVKNCPAVKKISEQMKLYNIIMNFLSRRISEAEVTSFVIIGEQGLQLLEQYYFLVKKELKTNILIYLLSSIENNKHVRKYEKMKNLLITILKSEPENHTVYTIFAKSLAQAVEDNTFCEYCRQLLSFCDNRELLWSTISTILPKIIKGINIPQLCTFMSFIRFQNISETSFGSKIMFEIIFQLQKQSLQKVYNIAPDGRMNIAHMHQDTLRKVCQIELFGGYIGNMPENEHTFSMQMILSKLMYSEEVENNLWEVETNKKLFLFQIYLKMVFELLATEENKVYENFIQILIWYVEINTRRENFAEFKSYLRYIIYYTTYKSIQNCSKCYLALWIHILTNIIIKRINQETNSFEDLLTVFIKENISPIFVEDLQIFIKIIPFEQLKALKQLQNQKKVEEKLMNILKSKEFINSMIFEGKIDHIMMKIDEFNQQLIFTEYSSQKQIRSETSGTEKNFKRNIQKLFDYENIAEQNSRIKYLHEQQSYIRNCSYIWQKIWNKLRVYHQPYGFWMAQRDDANVFVYDKQSKKMKNFKYQISEYSTNSGMQPILQPKMLEPWHIIKDMKKQKSKLMHSFSEMMKPSHSKEEPSQKQQNLFVNLLKNIWKPIPMKKAKKIKEYEVIWIQRSMKLFGRLFIRDNEQLIFFNEGVLQEESHMSFEKCSLSFNRRTYCQWNIFQIKKLRIHRYLMKYRALEIVLCNSKCLIFEFVKENRKEFIQQLQKIQKQRLQINQRELFKLNNVPFFKDDFFKLDKWDDRITQLWKRRDLSNLQYLIQVNKKASRGIYDLSQYPVVPWIIQVKNQKQPTLRELSKTMGDLGSAQRKKILFEKYHTKDPFNPFPPFFYGTHYSSPGVIFNFLIRLSPFAEYCKHLQGGKFDIPDRLFSSFVNAWKSAYNQVSDVRELIPQFYYLPEIFINLDGYNFGLTQSKERVDNVELPSWSTSNPYFFTSQMRTIMENENVSNNINGWIDLIFGYKQRGKEAEESWNVYYYLTYEDFVEEEDEQEDNIYQKSKQAQIVHFGQIPPLLFDKPHVKRDLRKRGISELEYTKTIKLINSLKEKPISLNINGSQMCIIKRNLIEIYSLHSNPAALQKTKKFNFEKSQSLTYYLIKKDKANIVFMSKGYFICWGYFNHDFRIFNKHSGELKESDYVDSKITFLFLNEEESLILIGCQRGTLHIYEVEYGLKQVFIKKIMTEVFPAPISHISEYDGFYAISFGNCVSIYKIHRTLHYLYNKEQQPIIKFFRSFRINIPIKASFILASPLFSIAIIDNANIRTYSINGQFIKKIPSNAKHYGRFVDSDLQDVIYTIEQDRVVCFSVPDLRSVSILELEEYDQIHGRLIVNRNSILQFGYTNAQ